jgi:hypothetical protein
MLGKAAGFVGTLVTITGENLYTWGPPDVKFGDVAVGGVNNASGGSSMQVYAPAGNSGTVTVTVTTSQGSDSSHTFRYS